MEERRMIFRTVWLSSASARLCSVASRAIPVDLPSLDLKWAQPHQSFLIHKDTFAGHGKDRVGARVGCADS
jgi:hypothetical protein